MLANTPPMLGEPLVVELANTRFANRGKQLDGLGTTDDLASWLAELHDRLPLPLSSEELDAITPDELAAARELRDAVRVLLAGVTAGKTPDAAAAETVNAIVRAAPRWRELTTAPEPHTDTHTASTRVAAVLAAIAEEGALLLTGPDARTLKACTAPGCILYYRKNHPRRAWCSPRCSNRVRAARH